MKRLFSLAAVAVLVLGMSACATTPEGQPDCSQAANQRAVIQTALAGADLAYSQAVEFCKAGEPGDKCRDIAAKAKAAAVTAGNIALLALNARCPAG